MSQYMIGRASGEGYIEAVDGVLRKTLVYGDNTLMTEFRMDKGSQLPPHAHPHEQTGYLIAGKVILNLGEKEYKINPGDSWSIPGNETHSMEVLEDSIAVEVFSPVREDFLP